MTVGQLLAQDGFQGDSQTARLPSARRPITPRRVSNPPPGPPLAQTLL